MCLVPFPGVWVGARLHHQSHQLLVALVDRGRLPRCDKTFTLQVAALLSIHFSSVNPSPRWLRNIPHWLQRLSQTATHPRFLLLLLCKRLSQVYQTPQKLLAIPIMSCLVLLRIALPPQPLLSFPCIESPCQIISSTSYPQCSQVRYSRHACPGVQAYGHYRRRLVVSQWPPQ